VLNRYIQWEELLRMHNVKVDAYTHTCTQHTHMHTTHNTQTCTQWYTTHTPPTHTHANTHTHTHTQIISSLQYT